MQIFTSYFGRKAMLERAGIVPICIALWKPRWYEGISYLPVAPKAFMLKDENQTQEQYIERYNRLVLGTLRVENVVRDIERLSGGRDAALLCYEKPGDFCHRHLLAKWITEESGVEVKEWMTDEESKAEELRKKKEAEPKIEEPSLFDLF